jgi:hypothetical protein
MWGEKNIESIVLSWSKEPIFYNPLYLDYMQKYWKS